MVKTIKDINQNDINRGYELIKQCIDYVLERDNIKFKSSWSAPNIYNTMVQSFEDLGYFEVYSGGDHGYLGEEHNIKFRALHDAMHYENGLTFKFDDERILSEMTSREFASIAYNRFNATHWEMMCVREIITAEIKGQIDYYEKNKEYVKDQKEFILNYFNLGRRK